MILKTCFLLALSVVWEVYGVSYSNVYVKTGPEVGPAVDYLKYGAPSQSYEFASPQVAQYNTAPFTYDYPFGQSYSFRTMCPSGVCVYPEQTRTSSIATAAPAANVLTYNAPVSTYPSYVYGRSDPATSYSYVLVNQGAGQDLKLSDGEVIRGGYSFLQPEGLVQYVADDNQGLNAIFKTYIPTDAVAQTETVRHETIVHESVHHPEPCAEAKSEAYTVLESREEEHEGPHESEENVEHVPHHESHESHHESHESHHESGEPHHDSHETHHESHESHHESHEARHGGHEEPEIHEYVVHDGHIESVDSSHEAGHHSHEDHIIVIHNSAEVHHEPESGEHETHDHETHEHESHDHESHEHGSHEHESHEHHEIEHEGQHEEEEEPAHESHETHHTHEAIVEATHEPHESHEHHEGHLIPQVPALVDNNVYISYNDFVKCIQAAMARGNTHPFYAPIPKPTTSPLTYLVFNKPC